MTFALAPDDVDLPLDRLRLVAVNGVTAQRQQVGGGVKVTFNKTGEERRFLALEAQPRGNLSGVKALVLRCRVNLAGGQPPRLAMKVFERGGGVWFKVGQPIAVGQVAESRLSITGLRLAEFSEDANGQMDWDKVGKVWVGLVVDGKVSGSFEIHAAQFTRAPYTPHQPLRITGDGAGVWSVMQDPAVQSKLTTPNEGPNGKPCMKFEFTLPGGRHMYTLPTVSVPEAELDGYRGLQLTYKATLPAGNPLLQGLLVLLHERDGSQYYASPAPPPAADWRTLLIPFASFTLGEWSRDENGRLDVDQIAAVSIGVHGTALEAGGSGVIYAADVVFAP
ncbi:MAG: hypothetical protein NZT92_15170 [Abditibacteriales bacterium]|nr:hypothetical protein [Abditibacteriales bacterium]MDW8366216.1 hypothetical protein [Abditibacteriales bacterium]